MSLRIFGITKQSSTSDFIEFHRVVFSGILIPPPPPTPRPTSAAFLGVFHEANSRQEIRFIRSNDIKSLNQITCLFSSVSIDHNIAAQKVPAEWLVVFSFSFPLRNNIVYIALHGH